MAVFVYFLIFACGLATDLFSVFAVRYFFLFSNIVCNAQSFLWKTMAYQNERFLKLSVSEMELLSIIYDNQLFFFDFEIVFAEDIWLMAVFFYFVLLICISRFLSVLCHHHAFGIGYVSIFILVALIKWYHYTNIL